MAVKYYYKMRAQLSNPSLGYTVVKESCVVYEVARISLPLSTRIHRILQELNLNKGVIKSVFSYKLFGIDKSTWVVTLPEVNLALTMLRKQDTPAPVYKGYLRNYSRQGTHAMKQCIQTAQNQRMGLKQQRCAGRRREWNHCRGKRLCLQLMCMPLSIAKQKVQRAVIYNDSYSALVKFTRIESMDPLVRRIQHDIHELLGRDTFV